MQTTFERLNKNSVLLLWSHALRDLWSQNCHLFRQKNYSPLWGTGTLGQVCDATTDQRLHSHELNNETNFAKFQKNKVESRISNNAVMCNWCATDVNWPSMWALIYERMTQLFIKSEYIQKYSSVSFRLLPFLCANNKTANSVQKF